MTKQNKDQDKQELKEWTDIDDLLRELYYESSRYYQDYVWGASREMKRLENEIRALVHKNRGRIRELESDSNLYDSRLYYAQRAEIVKIRRLQAVACYMPRTIQILNEMFLEGELDKCLKNLKKEKI
ncbi:MAG TPA: hypothetical protein ENI23_09360 [bacterium]|nr:hypothetical protein [bacterium]